MILVPQLKRWIITLGGEQVEILQLFDPMKVFADYLTNEYPGFQTPSP